MIAQRKQFEEKKQNLKGKLNQNQTADSSMSNISVGLANSNGTVDDQNENYR
jgi:hypothetical protein